jgi:hypothetical protein
MTKWQPIQAPVPKFGKVRKDDWVLLDDEGKELARVYDTEKPNQHGEAYLWAVWPYQRLGNVGSSANVIDARLKAEKVVNQI